MDTTKVKTTSQEQRQDTRRPSTELDDRYGKIGISAVAAAVRHKGEKPKSKDAHLIPYDCD
jgi:hypothetical protein